MISITNGMRPFLFGPSIMNMPEFQRLRAATVQRLKQPAPTVQRFKAHKSASKGASKRKVSVAEAQERCQVLAHKERLHWLANRPAKRQMTVAEAESRLEKVTRGAAAESLAVAVGLRAGILRRPLAWS